MNKQEYWRNFSNDEIYEIVHKMLKDWKQQNGIAERCVVHHRDDNDEVRSYNESHYEQWGLNPDGTFEYGKYVVFMTHSDHMKYHHKGNKYALGYRHTDDARQRIKNHNSRFWKGKNFSDEHKQHLKEAKSKEDRTGKNNTFYGKTHSAETKQRMSEKAKASSYLYGVYKQNGGILQWNDFRKALKASEITFEMQPVSVFVK